MEAGFPFIITYQEKELKLSHVTLPPLQEDYLKNYLQQINHYRVIGFYQGAPVYSLYQPPLSLPSGHRSLRMRLERRFQGVRIPASATIAVNNRCQCDCAHCSAVFYNKSQKKPLSRSDLKEALRQTAALGATTVILLGGEPLLRRDLPELIRSIPPDQATVILFTNGELLTLETCHRLKEAGLMGAFISLDSADAHRHDRLRKRHGLFYRALLGIENLLKTGLIASISSYLSHQRLLEDGFEEIMELGKKVGAHEVTFFDAIPSGRWMGDETRLLTPPDRILIRNLTALYRARPQYPGLSVQSTMTSECGSAFCFAANTQFYMTAFGEMCPCDFTPLTIGKFPDEPIDTLWHRMINTPPYHQRAKSCRMQDTAFRRLFIDRIPKTGPFPYPL